MTWLVLAQADSATKSTPAWAYAFWIIVALAVVAYGVWAATTETGRAHWEHMKELAEERRKKKAADPKGKKLSQVGTKGPGGLACPKCGSTQFRVRSRRTAECVACRNRYRRG